MKKLLSLVLGLVILGCGGGVIAPYDACAIKLSWDNATTNADGTPINGLVETRVYNGPSTGVYDDYVGVDPAVEWAEIILPDGFYCYSATHVDQAGNESEYSNEICNTIDTIACSNPTNLRFGN